LLALRLSYAWLEKADFEIASIQPGEIVVKNHKGNKRNF
jgi:hypothetical protein